MNAKNILTGCLLILSSSMLLADQSLTDPRERVVKYVEALNASDYQTAAKLLHYPEDLKGAAKEDEVQKIAKAIEIFSAEFGMIGNYRISKGGRYIHIFVMAGTLEYWAKKLDGEKLTYDVTFSKKGKGYLIFQYSQVGNRPVLRAVQYGLPASQPDAAPIMKRIMLRLREEVGMLPQDLLQPTTESSA